MALGVLGFPLVVLAAIGNVPLAAVPVLVPYGKAGVKGCDFVVIIHVHILLCVHAGVLYTFIDAGGICT